MTQRNNDLREKILNYYNDILQKECGISWRKAVATYSKIGNAPGVYPDVPLLFTKLIKHFKLKNLVEFGSGMSTLFLTKVAQDLGISFTSYEEQPKYLDMTLKLLESFSLEPNIKLFDPKERIKLDGVDFLFLDSSGELRKFISRQPKDPDTFTIMDDINDIPYLIPLYAPPYWFYCGTGRLERYIFIKYPHKVSFGNFLTQEMHYL